MIRTTNQPEQWIGPWPVLRNVGTYVVEVAGQSVEVVAEHVKVTGAVAEYDTLLIHKPGATTPRPLEREIS